MARQRYTTTSPTFSNDFMFQAPWELAMSALQFNEKQVDTIYDQAQMLGDATANINFLEADRENVNAEKQLIDAQVNELTTALGNDPTQWKKQMPKIRQISQNLQANMRTGNLSKIQSSFNSYQSFLKNYEDLRKKDPQEFDRVSQFYLNNWKNTNEKGSLSSIFTPGAVYAPKALSDKEFTDILKDFKADEFTTLDGLYKIDNKVVTKDQVAQAAINLATSNPDFANFIRQRQMIGDDSYRTPIYMNIDNTTGQPLSPEEVQQRQEAFSNRALEIEKIFTNPTLRAQHTPQQLEEMKAELRPSFTTMLNPQNAIAQQANALGNIYSFKSQKITGNEPAIMMYKEGQANARQAQSIAAADRRQANAHAHEEKMLDKRQENEQANIKLKAELAPTKGSTGKGKGKEKGSVEPLTTSGESFFPTWGTSFAQDMGIIKGEEGTKYEQMLVNSKVSTLTDAAATSALNKTSNKNDKDVRGIVNFISRKIKDGDKSVIELISEGNAKGNNTSIAKKLSELYFKETYKTTATKKDESFWGGFFEAMGKAGSPGAPVLNASTPQLNQYQEASAVLDKLTNTVRGAVDTYVSEYVDRNDKLRKPKAEANYFGLNTRSPQVREFENNMNINIGEYQFYKTNDLVNPVTNVSQVKLKNITDSYGGMPVSFIVADEKGNTYKAVPNAKRAQNDLDYISQNSNKMVTATDTAKTNLYFGNGGKNANLASAFDYTASVGDKKQIVPISTNTGKQVKITKELTEVKGSTKMKISINYPGAKPIEAIVDPSTISNANQNSAIIQMLDKTAKENNFNYYLR